MANHKSALKRIRTNQKRTHVRGSRVTFLRTLIKNVELAINNKDLSTILNSEIVNEIQYVVTDNE